MFCRKDVACNVSTQKETTYNKLKLLHFAVYIKKQSFIRKASTDYGLRFLWYFIWYLHINIIRFRRKKSTMSFRRKLACKVRTQVHQCLGTFLLIIRFFHNDF